MGPPPQTVRANQYAVGQAPDISQYASFQSCLLSRLRHVCISGKITQQEHHTALLLALLVVGGFNYGGLTSTASP